MKFWKYQGTGNDFIVLNNTNLQLKHSSDLAKKLCDRHFGIGSDGLIIIEPSDTFDFNMVFYNPDGSQSFCGNGSRCAVKFAFDRGIIHKKETSFNSTDGQHTALILKDTIKLSMANPMEIPLDEDYSKFNIITSKAINTGSPHLLLMLKEEIEINKLNVKSIGAEIRYSEAYKEKGINVNFILESQNNSIQIRTYERGVEDETLSCGTGVTASAIAYHSFKEHEKGHHLIEVESMGGQLQVEFNYNGTYTDVFLAGPTKMVFSGDIDL